MTSRGCNILAWFWAACGIYGLAAGLSMETIAIASGVSGILHALTGVLKALERTTE